MIDNACFDDRWNWPVIFGALVLIKFPNRPGGKIAWGGIEISSVGAGLPLIFLGVVCIMISNTGVPAKWDFWNKQTKSNGRLTTSFNSGQKGNQRFPQIRLANLLYP